MTLLITAKHFFSRFDHFQKNYSSQHLQFLAIFKKVFFITITIDSQVKIVKNIFHLIL